MIRNPTSQQQRWFLTLLGLSTVAVFLFLHPYRGLDHDARLYTIQALSHLQPSLYGNDIFVRMGSQDDYTLFSPLYAWLISWLGVEHAAAVLTLASLCLFLVAAWMLARVLLPQPQAAIALLVLLIVPAHYGSARIFHFLEEFITPRQLSEALTLLSLAAWLKEKRILAAALAAGAVLIHPIIGLSGVALLIALRWVLPHLKKLWPAAIAGILLALLALSGWLPIARWQFDATWYEIVQTKTYLYLLNWNAEDWSRVVTVLATLVIAAMSLRDQLRQIALAALIITGSLLLVALVGGDLLHIIVVVQAQPWRVLWLATVLAILLLPPIVSRNWPAGPMGRCASLLLVASWASSQSMMPLVIAPLAAIAIACTLRPLPIAHHRLLTAGAWLALALVVIHGLAVAQLSLGVESIAISTLPPQMDRFLTLCRNGVIPALILLVAGYVVVRLPSRHTLATLSALTIAIIAMVAVPAAKTWASARYTKEVREVFAGWREQIPPGSDVLWAGGGWGDGAMNTWLLLERPSFVSRTQAPNSLFSRAAALEMRSRAQQLWRRLPFIDPFRTPEENKRMSGLAGPLRLAPVCAASPVRYIVTTATFIDATPIAAPASAPFDLRNSKLYICP